MRRWFTIFAVIAALAFLTPAALNSQGRGQGKGQGKGQEKQNEAKENKGRGHQKHAMHDDRDEGWERHEGFEFRTFGDRDGRPPGWNRGKKTGWNNCGVPPGQAKKGACRTYSYHGRRYYYYQDEAGRMVVRRPVIVIR